MSVVDAHAHLYHPNWYPQAFTENLSTNLNRRTSAGAGGGVNPGRAAFLLKLLVDATGEKTIQLMDQIGIERRVIAVLDWELAMGVTATSISQIHQEILAVCRRFSDRLIGFAGIDPRRPQALSLVRHAMDSLGARGLKLHPTSTWTLEDDRVAALVECAAERCLPVLVHVGRTMPMLSDLNAAPYGLIKLAQRYPAVTFIAGHSGFEQWTHFLKVPTPPNVVFDIAGWQDLRADSSSRALAIQQLHAAFPGRVCFGTDSPFFTYNLVTSEASWLQSVRSCRLSESELESLLSGAALRDCFKVE